MDSFDIELVLDGPGASHDPEFGQMVLECFIEARAEADPIVEQNIESGRVAVNLTFDAEGLQQATAIVFEIAKAALAHMSPSLRITAMHVDPVVDRDGEAVLCAS